MASLAPSTPKLADVVKALDFAPWWKASQDELLKTLNDARTALYLEFNFFGRLVMRMKMIFVDDPRIKTAAVRADGVCYINPHFWLELDAAERAFVLTHELLHLAFLHFHRMGRKKPRRWNKAGDYLINGTLVKAGLKLPSKGPYKGLYNEQYTEEEWSDEEIYADLSRKAQLAREEKEKQRKPPAPTPPKPSEAPAEKPKSDKKDKPEDKPEDKSGGKPEDKSAGKPQPNDTGNPEDSENSEDPSADNGEESDAPSSPQGGKKPDGGKNAKSKPGKGNASDPAEEEDDETRDAEGADGKEDSKEDKKQSDSGKKNPAASDKQDSAESSEEPSDKDTQGEPGESKKPSEKPEPSAGKPPEDSDEGEDYEGSDMIPDPAKRGDGQGAPSDASDEENDGQEEDSGYDPDDDDDPDYDGDCDHGSTQKLHDERGEGETGDKIVTPTQWASILQNARQMTRASNRGTVPGNIDRWIEAIQSPTIPWARKLLRLTSATIKRGRSYRYPSRRSGAFAAMVNSPTGARPILPGPAHGFPPGVFAVDSSASRDDEQLGVDLGEAIGLLKTLQGVHLWGIVCDAEIQHQGPVRSVKDIQNFNIPGKGGTAFEPVFDLYRNCPRHKKPPFLVYFTDLAGSFPSYKPDYPVFWVYVGDGEPPPVPFGEVIVRPVKQERGDMMPKSSTRQAASSGRRP